MFRFTIQDYLQYSVYICVFPIFSFPSISTQIGIFHDQNWDVLKL